MSVDWWVQIAYLALQYTDMFRVDPFPLVQQFSCRWVPAKGTHEVLAQLPVGPHQDRHPFYRYPRPFFFSAWRRYVRSCLNRTDFFVLNNCFSSWAAYSSWNNCRWNIQHVATKPEPILSHLFGGEFRLEILLQLQASILVLQECADQSECSKKMWQNQCRFFRDVRMRANPWNHSRNLVPSIGLLCDRKNRLLNRWSTTQH